MATLSLLLLVMVLVVSTDSISAPGGGSNHATHFDELQLVLQWPITFCNTYYCDYSRPIKEMFTVHGLWLNQNSCPVICTTYPRELHLQITQKHWPIGSDDWPNLKDQQQPQNFWLEQYAKHGSCVEDFYNQGTYFQTAKAFKDQIGVETMRLSTGTLQMDHLYQVKDFAHATDRYGSKLLPTLRCMYPKGRPTQLYEIVFCKDKNGNQKQCTYKDNMACGGPFILPSHHLLRPPPFRRPRGWAKIPEPEFLTCSSRFPAQVPAFLPSSSRFPPGVRA